MANTGPENIANIPRLNALMDRDGYAALVLRSGQNFTYLAGFAFPGTLGRHLDLPDSPRAPLVVWPREGEPTLILNHQAAPLAGRESWVERIEIFRGYAESPYQKAAEVLGEMGLRGSRIGFERATINAGQWALLTECFPDAEISDCTRMMDKVRWIKTPGEVERIRQAAAILDEAYLEVFAALREGDTEREIHARIVEGCIRRGAEWAHGMLNPIRNTVIYGGEGDLAFRKGDIIRNDYVAFFRGYPGHQSRTVVLGEPTAGQERIYRTVLDIYRGTVARCRPGARAGDIYDFAQGAFREAGYDATLNLVGHGVGPWWHQQAPFIVRDAEDTLEEGMVIALEPHADFWHLQDMVLIAGDGPQLLSDRMRTDEIFVIDR
ncbi:MAG: Xaa-Pro peptidase family protein [Nitrospinota bacterium]